VGDRFCNVIQAVTNCHRFVDLVMLWDSIRIKLGLVWVVLCGKSSGWLFLFFLNIGWIFVGVWCMMVLRISKYRINKGGISLS
jgi:hypothetical protein